MAVWGSQARVWIKTGVSLIVWWVCVMPIWNVYWLGVLGQWSSSGTSHNRVHTFLCPDPPREAHIWVCSWLHRRWMEGVGRGLVGAWGDTPGASRGGEYFLTDKSSLPLRVAPCRVSEFSCHARTRIKLVGWLTTLAFSSVLYFVHMHKIRFHNIEVII